MRRWCTDAGERARTVSHKKMVTGPDERSARRQVGRCRYSVCSTEAFLSPNRRAPRWRCPSTVDAPHRRKRHLLRAEDPVRTPRTPMTRYPGNQHHAETISRIAAKHATRTPRPLRGPGPWLAGPEIIGWCSRAKEPQSIWGPCGFGTEVAISRDAGAPARKGRLSAHRLPAPSAAGNVRSGAVKQHRPRDPYRQDAPTWTCPKLSGASWRCSNPTFVVLS
jgi:hypothetical protein